MGRAPQRRMEGFLGVGTIQSRQYGPVKLTAAMSATKCCQQPHQFDNGRERFGICVRRETR
jgi:hypothetical protein